MSSYRSDDHESDKKDSESNVFNFMNLENTESGGNDTLSDIGIPEAQMVNDKDINKAIDIHQIADRMFEHSDTWICKTCDHKGDKWDLLSHTKYCKNTKK